MKRLIAFSVLLLLRASFLFSQSPVCLFASDSFRIFNGGNISIWGDFYNNASSASGGALVVNSGGNVYFYGDTFSNLLATQIGGTGNIEFRKPRPSPYSNSSGQTIISGGSSVSFPVITINTTSTVSVKSNDLKIRDSLKFLAGHVLLNKNDLIIGNGTPGVISGYTENRFIVTNSNTTDTLKGYLVRENVSSTAIVFPVGHAIGDYTPASLVNNGTADNFKVRAFDTVYENGYTLITNINPTANIRSIQRTWDISEGTPGGSNVNLTLQYKTTSEATLFSGNRSKAFITHFTGISPNNGGDTVSNWKWDMFKLSSTSTPISPGTITSGSSIVGASMKTRNNITTFSPFSITIWGTGAIPLPLEILNFEAVWANKENAMIQWKLTNTESLGSISLERSKDGMQYQSVRTFDLKTGAVSFNLMDIGIGKAMAQRVYYRLKLTDKAGKISSSKTLSLSKNIDDNTSQVTIYPNPGNKIFYIQNDLSVADEKFRIQLINVHGQVVYDKKPENVSSSYLGSIDISDIPPGIYELKIESANGTNVQKVIINH